MKKVLYSKLFHFSSNKSLGIYKYFYEKSHYVKISKFEQ